MSSRRRLAKPISSPGDILADSLPVNIRTSKIVLGLYVALGGRHAIPFYRLLRIPPHTFTIVITDSKIELRTHLPLSSRFAIPFHGFDCVLRDSLTGIIHAPKVELRVSVILFRCLEKPPHPFFRVSAHPIAIGIPAPKTELCFGVSVQGGVFQSLNLFRFHCSTGMTSIRIALAITGKSRMIFILRPLPAMAEAVRS
ncbi:MAG: hypothetical protein WC740_16600 [Verrucomicrobiia bacterium]